MYFPKRMQGRGRSLRILALWRVCSNTQDFETFSLPASSAGVRMSEGLKGAASRPRIRLSKGGRGFDCSLTAVQPVGCPGHHFGQCFSKIRSIVS
jgi:hypothetical protein